MCCTRTTEVDRTECNERVLSRKGRSVMNGTGVSCPRKPVCRSGGGLVQSIEAELGMILVDATDGLLYVTRGIG
jgi:hypothetical protein